MATHMKNRLGIGERGGEKRKFKKKDIISRDKYYTPSRRVDKVWAGTEDKMYRKGGKKE